MNIQIDTLQKTIKLSESVNLAELADVLNRLFPNNTWKEYKLETNTIINNWGNPIYIDRNPAWPTYPYPWTIIGSATDFTVTAGTTDTDFNVSQGVYNVSLNVENQKEEV